MPPAGPERQWLDAGHRRKVEIAIEMREQRFTARSFPFQSGTEAVSIHMHKQQVGHAGEMFGSGALELSGGGKVNETIVLVGWRSPKDAGLLGFAP
jgi:hypothetical protein